MTTSAASVRWEFDDSGLLEALETIPLDRPAAVAMLAPVIGGGNLAECSPSWISWPPQVSKAISGDRSRMGPLAAGERILAPADVGGTSFLEVRAVRGRRGAGHGGAF